MKLTLGPEVERRSHGSFGEVLYLPTAAGSVVLATQRLGLRPFRLLLPHQVYTRMVENELADQQAESMWALEVVTQWREIARREQ